MANRKYVDQTHTLLILRIYQATPNNLTISFALLRETDSSR